MSKMGLSLLKTKMKKPQKHILQKLALDKGK